MMRRRRRSGALQSEAVKFAKGKREVISWAFDDPANDMGSVYINSDASPSLNFKSSVSSDILAKFTGWSATSPIITRGPTGLLKHANHNLCLWSEEFNNGWWVKTAQGGGVSPTVTANAGIDPQGGTTAERVQFSRVGTAITDRSRLDTASFTLLPNTNYRFSIWLKSYDGTPQTVSIYNNYNTGESLVCTATSEWQEFSVTANSGASTSGPINLGLGYTVHAATTSDVLMWGAQFKQLPIHSTDYIATTSAAVFHIPTTYDTSGNKLGFLDWEARTNAAWWSRDLTQSAWTRTNCTAAKTATGTDGETNSASTLTASAANATCLQSITAVSAQRVSSCSIKRRTGAGPIEMTQDNGTTWTPITVTSEWTPVEIPAATVTNPIVGFRIVTSGDAIDVDHVQCEVGAKASPPIITAGAAVTRAAGRLVIANSALPVWNTVGSIIVKLTPQDVFYGQDIIGMSGAAGPVMIAYTGNDYASQDGTSEIAIAENLAVSGNGGSIGLSYGGASRKGCWNGGAVSSGAFDGSFGADANVGIGCRATGGNSFNGIISRFKIICGEQISDAELQAETA